MCFVHEYDWVAEVSVRTDGPAPARVRCDECRCLIHPGEWRYHLYQREREACLNCDPDAATDHGDNGECDHGEEYEYDRCERCDKVLKAIAAAEVAEGCRGNETQPALDELAQAVHDDDRYEDGRYAETALRMFPELAAHLWRLCPEYDLRDDWSLDDLQPVAELGGEA